MATRTRRSGSSLPPMAKAYAAGAEDQYVSPTKMRELVRKARRLFPLDAPVVVKRRSMKEYAGWCETTYRGKKGLERPVLHTITIDAQIGKAAVVDALLHEWAHALDSEGRPDPTADVYLHDAVFWDIYGQLYRAWHRTA